MSTEKINNRIKRLREERKLTVKELSSKIGIPDTTYREWEYGRAITGEPYVKLAKELQVSLSLLLTGEEPVQELELMEILAHIKKSHEKLEDKLRSLF